MKKIEAIESILAGSDVCQHIFRMRKEAALSNAVADFNIFTTVRITAAPGQTLPEKLQAYFRDAQTLTVGDEEDEQYWIRRLENDEFVGDMNILFVREGWTLQICSVYGVTYHVNPDRVYLQDAPAAVSLGEYINQQHSLPQVVFIMDAQPPLEGVARFFDRLMGTRSTGAGENVTYLYYT